MEKSERNKAKFNKVTYVFLIRSSLYGMLLKIKKTRKYTMYAKVPNTVGSRLFPLTTADIRHHKLKISKGIKRITSSFKSATNLRLLLGWLLASKNTPRNRTYIKTMNKKDKIILSTRNIPWLSRGILSFIGTPKIFWNCK